jgi:hypothetical protein
VIQVGYLQKAAVLHRHLRREFSIMVIREAVKGAAHLVKIIQANGLFGAQFGPRERRKQHGSEDSDDGYDNEKLDESECIFPSAVPECFHALNAFEHL